MPKPSENNRSDSLQVSVLNPITEVACHTLISGFAIRDLSDGLKTTRAKALILQSYGHDNALTLPEFIEAARQFTRKGGLLLNISQVPQGCAAAAYAQGGPLRQAGVLTAGKCSLETATALLTLAVSNGWDAATVTKKLEENRLVQVPCRISGRNRKNFKIKGVA